MRKEYWRQSHNTTCRGFGLIAEDTFFIFFGKGLSFKFPNLSFAITHYVFIIKGERLGKTTDID